MSTNKTEKLDDTATTSNDTTEQKANDNKKVFGPLGKYAIAAVIMVSIIVTTAIMLNKQLGTVDEQLAAIESEVAELNTAASANTVIEKNEVTATIAPAAAVEAEADKIEVAETEATPVVEQAATEKKVVEQVAVEQKVVEQTITETAIETPSAEVLVAKQEVSADVAEPATNVTPAQARHTQLAMENQARIEAHKLEQKQRMTEMFARIKTLEAQQLDQYKASQDKHVERLREQIAHQQQLIESLILRNKESLKMREARVQKHQTNREQMLERI